MSFFYFSFKCCALILPKPFLCLFYSLVITVSKQKRSCPQRLCQGSACLLLLVNIPTLLISMKISYNLYITFLTSHILFFLFFNAPPLPGLRGLGSFPSHLPAHPCFASCMQACSSAQMFAAVSMTTVSTASRLSA